VKTPGRDSELKLFTKKDYQAKVNQKDGIAVQTAAPVKDDGSALAVKVIAAYGGKENITNVDACITKLRVQVVDAEKVNREELTKLGARGVFKPSPNSVYSVFGFEADLIKNRMNTILFGK
jgi:glucose-like phosphotransferase system IIB component